MLIELITHHVTKFIGFLLLLFIWWKWSTKVFAPWYRSQMLATEGLETGQAAVTPRQFPILSLLVMIFVTGIYAYYVVMEHSFRTVHRIENRAMRDREVMRKEQDAQIVIPSPGLTEDEKLAERSRATKEKLEAENAAAKKRFSELPPVEGNGQGGATPK